MTSTITTGVVVLLLLFCGIGANNFTCPTQCSCKNNFKTVNCNGRSLIEVPKDIPECAEVLHLSHNDLGFIKNDSFPPLPNLIDLHLDVSQITGLDAHAFRGLTKLQHLYLFANTIEIIKVQEFCDDLASIENVYLDRNKLSGIPNFANCSKLTTLTLENNLIDDIKFPKDYEKSRLLTQLTLSLNPIHTIHKDDFHALRNAKISRLLLSRTSLRSVENGAFDPISQTLATLKISYNPHLNSTILTPIIDQLARCKALISLDLDGLQFNSRLPANFFNALNKSQMTSLSLRNNEIATIYSGTFSALTSLVNLGLSGSKIDTIEPTVFRGLDNLRHLDLSRNNLKEMPANLPYSLQDIRLDDNRITDMKDDGLARLSALHNLQLSKNSIQILGARCFGGLKNLETLDLSSNLISHIPRTTLSPVRHLRKLNLSKNKLSKIIKNVHVFEQLHRLTELDLSENGCSALPYTVFKNLTNLQTLNLDKNSLRLMLTNDKYGGTFAGLGNLKRLNLNNNDLDNLSPVIFKYLTNLSTLHMSHNRLTKWDKLLFTFTKKLKTLDLSNNKISVIDQNAFGLNFSEYGSINLEDNPFSCGCDLVKFLEWINQTKVKFIHFRNYTCDSPKHVQGVKLKDFDWRHLVCFDYYPYIIASSVVGGVVVLTLIVVTLYRCRWRMSLCCYRLGQKCRQDVNYQILQEDREYDAYISFAKKDFDFVDHVIMNKFARSRHSEGHPMTFQLCYEPDDMPYGSNFVPWMCEAVDNSHRAIIVITNAYLSAPRHQMELDHLHATSLQHSFSLIFVTTGSPLKLKLLPKWLHNSYKNGRFIVWDEDPSAQEEFNSKLERKLRTVPPVRDDNDEPVSV